jgi:hypothetical protein
MSLPNAAQLAALEELVRANKLGDVLPTNWRTAVAEWQPSAAEVSAIKQVELAAHALDQLRYRPMPKFIPPAVLSEVKERLPTMLLDIRRLADLIHGKTFPDVSLGDSAALFAASVDFLAQSLEIGAPATMPRWRDACERFAAGVATLERSTRATMTVHATTRYTIASRGGLLGLITTTLWLASWLTSIISVLRFLSDEYFTQLITGSTVFGTGFLGENVNIQLPTIINAAIGNIVGPGENPSLLQVLVSYERIERLGYMPLVGNVTRSIHVPSIVTTFDQFVAAQLNFALGRVIDVHGAPGAALFWIISWLLGRLTRWVRAGLERIQSIEYVTAAPDQAPAPAPASADPAEDSDSDGLLYD